MKTINKLLIILSVLGLASCQLDVLPPTGIPSETFWKTDKDAWYALNTLYRNMPAYSKLISDEMTTDNAHSQKPWEGNYVMVQQDGISASDGYGDYNFASVRDANTFLANVDKCTLAATVKERMKAEARFFRAYAYFDLHQYFGKVAIVTEPMAYNAPTVPRDPVEKVRQFVLDELAAVAEILPESYSGGYLNEEGRVTKYAVWALRARAALYFGDYVTAEADAAKVMASNKYSLFKLSSLNDNQKKEADEMDLYIDWAAKGIDKNKFMLGMFSYESLWQAPNADVKNPEYVLVHEYAPDPATVDEYRFRYMQANHMTLQGGYSSLKPIQDLISAYWDIDGKTVPAEIPTATRKANYDVIWKDAKDLSKADFAKFATDPKLTTYEYMKEFKNRDSRLYASNLFPFKGWHNSAVGPGKYYRWDPALISQDGNESWSGYSYRKIISITPYNTHYSADDYPLIRYAEVLLTFAEAHTINSGYDGAVQSALNLLRDRCGMVDVPSGLSGQDALDFIRNERRIELSAEGHRYNDIRRYGSNYARKVMTGTTCAPSGDILLTKSWNDRLMLMPIPTSAIDVNPLLKGDQNSGY